MSNIRYEDECKMLAYLAKRQLNLEKNKVKENFEDLEIEDVFNLSAVELREVYEEFMSYSGFNGYSPKKEINYESFLSEIGDVAACLVGMIAWINKHRGIDNAKTDTH